METLNIYQAINKIQAECPAIAKDQRNDIQKFNFRGIDTIMNELNPLFSKYGIFVIPEILSVIREERPSKSGGNIIFTLLQTKYTFYAQDGSSVAAIIPSEGMDSSDKGTSKAMSMAYKNLCVQVFCIPTIESEETEYREPEFPGDEIFLRNYIALTKVEQIPFSLEQAKSITNPAGIEYRNISTKDLYALQRNMYKAQGQVKIREEKAKLMTKLMAIDVILLDRRNQLLAQIPNRAK